MTLESARVSVGVNGWMIARQNFGGSDVTANSNITEEDGWWMWYLGEFSKLVMI